MEKLRQQIEQRLSAVMGDACFYYENLATGVCFGHAADKPVVAASVIKLAVLIEAFRQMDTDAVRANEMFVIARTDKLPSCGALNYLHDGLCVTFRDRSNLVCHERRGDGIHNGVPPVGVFRGRFVNLQPQRDGCDHPYLNRANGIGQSRLLRPYCADAVVSRIFYNPLFPERGFLQ